MPTDARLLLVQDLQADESLLTGESVPVRKSLLGTGGNETALIQMAARGLRVRGIAKGMAMARALPQSQ